MKTQTRDRAELRSDLSLGFQDNRFGAALLHVDFYRDAVDAFPRFIRQQERLQDSSACDINAQIRFDRCGQASGFDVIIRPLFREFQRRRHRIAPHLVSGFHAIDRLFLCLQRCGELYQNPFQGLVGPESGDAELGGDFPAGWIDDPQTVRRKNPALRQRKAETDGGAAVNPCFFQQFHRNGFFRQAAGFVLFSLIVKRRFRTRARRFAPGIAHYHACTCNAFVRQRQQRHFVCIMPVVICRFVRRSLLDSGICGNLCPLDFERDAFIGDIGTFLRLKTNRDRLSGCHLKLFQHPPVMGCIDKISVGGFAPYTGDGSPVYGDSVPVRLGEIALIDQCTCGAEIPVRSIGIHTPVAVERSPQVH